MAQFDLRLDELRAYRPPRHEPADFDAFWSATIAGRAARHPTAFTALETPLRTIATFDVTFSGYAGQEIRAWLLDPGGRDRAAPDHRRVRGLRRRPRDPARPAALGVGRVRAFRHGHARPGGDVADCDTSDIEPTGTGPQVPGVMTRGILDPSTYYYRRLIADAVLAVDAAREHPIVDPARVVVAGASQGGGLALAAAALAPGLAGALVDVPFLCHFRRALDVSDALPYDEIRQFLRTHRTEEARVFRTLGYVDGRHFAARATVPPCSGRPRGRGHAAVDRVRRLQRVRGAEGHPGLAVQRPRGAGAPA